MFTSAVLRAARKPPLPLARLRLHPRRLVIVPSVAALERTAAGSSRVRVDGMVCAACAARTRAAFARVNGVSEVRVDLDAGIAELRFEADTPARVALQRALDAVVVAKPARRLLARLASSVTRGAGRGS